MHANLYWQVFIWYWTGGKHVYKRNWRVTVQDLSPSQCCEVGETAGPKITCCLDMITKTQTHSHTHRTLHVPFYQVFPFVHLMKDKPMVPKLYNNVPHLELGNGLTEVPKDISNSQGKCSCIPYLSVTMWITSLKEFTVPLLYPATFLSTLSYLSKAKNQCGTRKKVAVFNMIPRFKKLFHA